MIHLRCLCKVVWNDKTRPKWSDTLTFENREVDVCFDGLGLLFDNSPAASSDTRGKEIKDGELIGVNESINRINPDAF